MLCLTASRDRLRSQSFRKGEGSPAGLDWVTTNNVGWGGGILLSYRCTSITDQISYPRIQSAQHTMFGNTSVPAGLQNSQEAGLCSGRLALCRPACAVVRKLNRFDCCCTPSTSPGRLAETTPDTDARCKPSSSRLDTDLPFLLLLRFGSVGGELRVFTRQGVKWAVGTSTTPRNAFH